MKQVYSTFWFFKIMKQWRSETASILLKYELLTFCRGNGFTENKSFWCHILLLTPRFEKRPKGPDPWSWQKCHTMFFELQHPLNMHITIRKDDTINQQIYMKTLNDWKSYTLFKVSSTYGVFHVVLILKQKSCSRWLCSQFSLAVPAESKKSHSLMGLQVWLIKARTEM